MKAKNIVHFIITNRTEKKKEMRWKKERSRTDGEMDREEGLRDAEQKGHPRQPTKKRKQ